MSLYQAAKAGDLRSIQKQLAAGAKVDAVHRGRETLFGFSEDNGTALMAAAESGHLEAVRVLLDAGARPRMKDANGADALLRAVAPGHIEVVALLLESGADPNARGPEGRNALSIAAWAGHESVARLLITRGADVTVTDSAGVTALHFALRQRRLAVARLLIAAGAPVNPADRDGNTPLHDACQKLFLVDAVDESVETPTHLALVDLLLEAGARVNALDRNGWTPFHRAVMDDRVETASRLMARGADVNTAAANGRYPLMMACDNLDMTQRLLQAGAKVDAVDEDRETALFQAVNGESEPVIRALVAAGANINHVARGKRTVLDDPVEEGNVALFELLLSLGAVDVGGRRIKRMGAVRLCKAAAEGDIERTTGLLASGVPPDAHEEDEAAALWRAATGGHLDVVRTLLAAGADPNRPGDYESRALHRAAARGNRELVDALLAAGADPNVTYEREWGDGFVGWTPLMEAAESGSLEAVQSLVVAGADRNAVTKNGYTPLICAGLGGDREIIDYLLASGAKSRGVVPHILEMAAFVGRLRTVEAQEAINELSARIGAPVTFSDELPGVALFDVSATLAYVQRKEALVTEMARILLDEQRFVSESEALEATKSGAGFQAAAETQHAIVEQHQQSFLERGCYVVAVSGFTIDSIALLPTTNLYPVVACLGPAPRGVPKMLRWLEKLQKEFPFRLRGAGGATLHLQFLGTVADRDALAATLFRQGADECGIVTGGKLANMESRDELAAALTHPDPVVRLWWD